jgi:hypothetical protein
MKTKTLIYALFFVVNSLSAQLIATMEVKEPIPGTCSEKTVYALFSGFKGQTEPKPPLTKEEIQTQLTNTISFIKDNPKFKGKLMISCIINCKGEMVKCSIDNKSGNDDLDKQVLTVFSLLLKWSPGIFDNKNVDCVELFSVEVKKGKIKLV